MWCPRYNTRLHQMVRLKFWRVWSTHSLPLLQGPFWPGVVIPVRVPFMYQIDQFENCLCLKGIIIIIKCFSNSMSSCWLAYTGTSMCRVHQRTLLVSSSLFLQQYLLFTLLGWFLRWVGSGHATAVLKDVGSKICSK